MLCLCCRVQRLYLGLQMAAPDVAELNYDTYQVRLSCLLCLLQPLPLLTLSPLGARLTFWPPIPPADGQDTAAGAVRSQRQTRALLTP